MPQGFDTGHFVQDHGIRDPFASYKRIQSLPPNRTSVEMAQETSRWLMTVDTLEALRDALASCCRSRQVSFRGACWRGCTVLMWLVTQPRGSYRRVLH